MGAPINNQNSRKYSLNFDYFKSWTKKMAFLLGYIFAEGNINISKNRGNREALQIESKDRDVLNFFNKELGKPTPSKKRTRYRRERKKKIQITYYTTICSKEIVRDLDNLGVIPRKANKMRFPSVPTQFLKYFFWGYLIGDGCLKIGEKYTNKNNKKRIYYSLWTEFKSKSGCFLKAFNQNINQILKIEGKIYFDKSGDAYLLRFCSSLSFKILNWLGKSSQIKREQLKYINFRNNFKSNWKNRLYPNFIAKLV